MLGDPFVSRLSHSSYRYYERSLARRALDHCEIQCSSKRRRLDRADHNTIMKRETVDSGRDIRDWFLGVMAYAILFYFLFQPEQFMKAVEWLARLVQN